MYDFEIEKNIIGGLLNDNTKLDSVVNIISEDDFGKTLYKNIFTAIKKGLSDNIEINIKTLLYDNSFKKDMAEIASLTTNAPSGNVLFFANKLKELTIKRTLQVLSEVISEGIKAQGVDLNGIIETAENMLSSLTVSKTSHEIRDFKAVLQDAIKEIEAASKTKGLSGADTGFRKLNDFIGGFNKQELIIIAARTGIGKTSLALNIAENMASKNIPVGFFNLEMKDTELAKRILCSNSGVSYVNVRRGYFEKNEYNNIYDACSKMYEYPIYTYDYENAPLLDIKAKARKLKRQSDIKVLFIDYIGLITYPGNMQRWEKMGIVSRELKGLARELDISIVALAQVGRDAEGKMPTLANLRDSGSIEQDADAVLFIHRQMGSGTAELLIAKNRNGELRKIDMLFDGVRTRFSETTSPDAVIINKKKARYDN